MCCYPPCFIVTTCNFCFSTIHWSYGMNPTSVSPIYPNLPSASYTPLNSSQILACPANIPSYAGRNKSVGSHIFHQHRSMHFASYFTISNSPQKFCRERKISVGKLFTAMTLYNLHSVLHLFFPFLGICWIGRDIQWETSMVSHWKLPEDNLVKLEWLCFTF